MADFVVTILSHHYGFQKALSGLKQRPEAGPAVPILSNHPKCAVPEGTRTAAPISDDDPQARTPVIAAASFA